jgi:hypothetical protein
MVGSLGHLEIPLPDRLWVCETCMQQRESTHHLTAIWSRDRMPIPASQNGFEMRRRISISSWVAMISHLLDTDMLTLSARAKARLVPVRGHRGDVTM